MAAFGLIILEMKADNELAISLLTVYLKKMTKKTVKKKFLMTGWSRTLDLQCVRYCATTTIVEQNC